MTPSRARCFVSRVDVEGYHTLHTRCLVTPPLLYEGRSTAPLEEDHRHPENGDSDKCLDVSTPDLCERPTSDTYILL